MINSRVNDESAFDNDVVVVVVIVGDLFMLVLENLVTKSFSLDGVDGV